MGMLIGYRFKGIVKKELRDIFEPIALEGRWEESPDPFLRNFTYNSWKFPCSYDGHVRRWCKDTWQRSYNKETGEWIFEADMNANHSPCSEWEHSIIPYCMESISHYEVWEECNRDAWKKTRNIPV